MASWAQRDFAKLDMQTTRGLLAAVPAAELVGHRISPPRSYPQIKRLALLRALTDSEIVFLCTPSGYGKTTLARQLVDTRAEPTAWFTADTTDQDSALVSQYLYEALAAAWWPGKVAGDLNGSPQGTLAGLLTELDRPGSLVIDEVHTARPDVIDRVLDVVLAARPVYLRVVLCGQGEPPAALVHACAGGLARIVGPEDLRFTADETREVIGFERGDKVHAETGGWPLAVGLVGRAGPGADAVGASHRSFLRAVVLADLRDGADLFALATRLPRIPLSALEHVAQGAELEALEVFARRHPSLVTIADDGWWAARDVLRDVLARERVPTGLVQELVSALVDANAADLALDLAVREQLWDTAVALLEAEAFHLDDTGRSVLVRDYVAALPPARVTPRLRIADLAARASMDLVDEAELRRVEAEMWDVGTAEGLATSRVLVNQLGLQLDPNIGAALWTALGRACEGDVTDATLARLLEDDDPAVIAEAAYLVYVLGTLFLLTGSEDDCRRGLRLCRLADEASGRIGLDLARARGQALYVQVMTGVCDLEHGLGDLRLALAALRRRRSKLTGYLMLLSAHLCLLADDPDSALAYCAEAEASAELIANRNLRTMATAGRLVCEIWLGERDVHDEFEAHWRAALVGYPRRMCDFAVLAGHGYLNHHDEARARVWSDRAAASGHMNPIVQFEKALLDARLCLAAGPMTKGARRYEHLADGADALGRHGSAARARAQLRKDLASWYPKGVVGRRATGVSPGLAIAALAPELLVTKTGEAVEPPSGNAARLLALLIAERGPVDVEQALELLWPDTRPDIGRNRLYGLIHKLRGFLRVGRQGAVRLEHGLLRLDPSAVRVDVWDFLDGLDGNDTDVAAALALYADDFCRTQLGYEPFAEDLRRDLRRRFTEAAIRYCRERLAAGDAQAAGDVAVRLAVVAPTDEEACILAVEVLAGAGRARMAGDVLARSVDAVEDLGLPAEDLLRRGQVIIDGTDRSVLKAG